MKIEEKSMLKSATGTSEATCTVSTIAHIKKDNATLTNILYTNTQNIILETKMVLKVFSAVAIQLVQTL